MEATATNNAHDVDGETAVKGPATAATQATETEGPATAAAIRATAAAEEEEEEAGDVTKQMAKLMSDEEVSIEDLDSTEYKVCF
jgi:hypothetical protein